MNSVKSLEYPKTLKVFYPTQLMGSEPSTKGRQGSEPCEHLSFLGMKPAKLNEINKGLIEGDSHKVLELTNIY